MNLYAVFLIFAAALSLVLVWIVRPDNDTFQYWEQLLDDSSDSEEK